MTVSTYRVTSKIEIDNLLAEAQVQGKTAGEIHQWAIASIPELDLRVYCLDRAEQLLGR